MSRSAATVGVLRDHDLHQGPHRASDHIFPASQLLVAFAAVIVVFGIGVVVSVSSLSGVSSTLNQGTERVKMADTLSIDTYNIEQIAASSAQIVDSATRMAENVSSVANVAEESSASTEEVSAATEQTSASTQQIASSAQELSTTADELQRLISQFTLS